jgi:hypothetical protein
VPIYALGDFEPDIHPDAYVQRGQLFRTELCRLDRS